MRNPNVKPIPEGYHTLTDPFGHQWTVATHVEDVSPEAMQKRMAAMKTGI